MLRTFLRKTRTVCWPSLLLAGSAPGFAQAPAAPAPAVQTPAAQTHAQTPGAPAAAGASAAAAGPIPRRMAVIEIQNAVFGTKVGQKAIADLKAKYDPRAKELEQRQNEIRDLQDKLKNAKTDNERASLNQEFNEKNQKFQRDTQDAQSDYQDELRKLMDDLGQKMLPLIDQYLVANGYAVLMNLDNQNNPVIYFSPSVNITKDIIDLYDKLPAAAPAKPAAPPAPAPAKKQP